MSVSQLCDHIPQKKWKMALTTSYGGSLTQELKILKSKKGKPSDKNKLGLFSYSHKQFRHKIRHFKDTAFKEMYSLYILRYTGQE